MVWLRVFSANFFLHIGTPQFVQFGLVNTVCILANYKHREDLPTYNCLSVKYCLINIVKRNKKKPAGRLAKKFK
jgi:hypothetical protein